MRWILLSLIFLCACSTPRLVTSSQVDAATQAESDAVAAYNAILDDPSVPSNTKLEASAIRDHVVTMGNAIGIDSKDLPKPRVTTDEWKRDANDAHAKSSRNTEHDNEDITSYGLKAVAGAGALGLIAAIGKAALGSHPIGVFAANMLSMVGGENPMRRKIYDKIVRVLEEYKETDPNWKDNKLYAMLSDRLTTVEKDFIKNERHEL